MSHHQLDARRLICPLPVIRTQDFIKNLTVGDTVEVACTDPGAQQDIPAWCRINGHQVTTIDRQDHEIHITIEVSGD